MLHRAPPLTFDEIKRHSARRGDERRGELTLDAWRTLCPSGLVSPDRGRPLLGKPSEFDCRYRLFRMQTRSVVTSSRGGRRQIPVAPHRVPMPDFSQKLLLATCRREAGAANRAKMPVATRYDRHHRVGSKAVRPLPVAACRTYQIGTPDKQTDAVARTRRRGANQYRAPATRFAPASNVARFR